MFNSKCACSRCTPMWIGKILLIIGGVNWGLVGVGMLMSKDLNIVHMLLGSMSTVEAVVYILVGVAAVMRIFGCRCKKCMSACNTCGADRTDNNQM